VLDDHPAYGHRRIALVLKINKKRILRVMRLYHIQPTIRRKDKYVVRLGETRSGGAQRLPGGSAFILRRWRHAPWSNFRNPQPAAIGTLGNYEPQMPVTLLGLVLELERFVLLLLLRLAVVVGEPSVDDL